jgi:uncharacterized protein (TIGR03083 family)
VKLPDRLGRVRVVKSAGFAFFEAIAEHSAGLATAADGNLEAEVEHCPGWRVADLVRHVTEVHWFWATIAEERLSIPPEDDQRPAGAPTEQLIETFRAGADRLVNVLRAANGEDAVWTWAPAQQDIAFITRHQVQEAAVHHWDAVHAAGGNLVIAAPVAADAIAEFLTFSVSSDADPADPVRPDLNGRFALRGSDVDAGWTISDGNAPGTIKYETSTTPGVPAVTATASDLLLWLYGRVDLDPAPVSSDLIERFRALCFTD